MIISASLIGKNRGKWYRRRTCSNLLKNNRNDKNILNFFTAGEARITK